ncbi:MAG: alpha-L-fucosidase [bacterium]
MKRILSLAICALLMCMATTSFAQQKKYEPTWESIDSRPIPGWYDEAKFGIFIHWGVYSVPATSLDTAAEWLWYGLHKPNSASDKFLRETYGDKYQYQDFAPMFKAELFDPDKWADLFAKSGARYVVLTSKHHDGFANFPSDFSWNWNSMDVGPHRDLVGDLTKAVRAKNLKMGLYYSLYEWYNPLYLNHFNLFVDAHMIPQIKEIVNRYQPSIFWTDGEWDKTAEQWKSREIVSWLYNEAPNRNEIVTGDRWGSDTRNRHGGFYTSEMSGMANWNKLANARKWEECHCIGNSWGYSRNENVENYHNATELIHMLIEIVSRGGNLLLNVGPTADGRIPVIMQERLLEIGEWLKVNGESIYGTNPWRESSDGKKIRPASSTPADWQNKYTPIKSVRYTSKGDAVYAISLIWPGRELVLSAPVPAPDATVTMLGVKGNLKWSRGEDGKMHIEVPQLSIDELPAQHAYVFKLTGVK